LGTGVILAPGDVRPGHIMLAPLSTKRIAPLSTCSHGKRNGSENGKYKIMISIWWVFFVDGASSCGMSTLIAPTVSLMLA